MSQVWFITGTSSGFGQLFALEALERGDRVIASARNATKRPELEILKEKGAKLLDLDVSAPKSEIAGKMKEAVEIYGQIDVLVNNAGYLEMGFIEGMEEEKLMNQLNTNAFGAIRITQALLPHMRERRSGKIAFTGSIFGFYSMELCFPYAASKYMLAAFNETLSSEVSQFGIQSILFDIGHFRTPVISVAKLSVPTIPDYLPMMEEFGAMAAKIDGFQPGDPILGVKRMVDVLKGEGETKGKKLPLRMPIGGDAVELVKGRCEEMVKEIGEWEGLGRNTSFPGVEDAREKTKRTGDYRPSW
ncbi:related to ketoreductases [Phialocephala subalpina]|uniref:Related to ketoreductases n=1 Tax=Phialocephala subalpina TaxID=576137 RepID=A0A1L7XFT6_9HELO|nr:related to ketoreductases [Phialocephala subalpina]